MKILVIADEESKFFMGFFREKQAGRHRPDYFLRRFGSALSFFSGNSFHRTGTVRTWNHDGKYEKVPPEGCTCIEDQIYVHEGIRILGLGGSMR